MIGLLLATLGLALASAEGDAWLARIDQTARLETAHVRLSISVRDARGRTSARSIEIWQKGDDRRLVRMTAPSRLAGIGLLANPGGSLHMYLPNYPPARRVVGSKRADAFVGTDFAIEDLTRMAYAGCYTAEIDGKDGELTHLVLLSRSDPSPRDPHLWVDANAVVRVVEHRDDEGAVLRRLTLGDIRQVGSAQLPHRIEVTDMKRNRVTTAEIERIDTAADIDDAVFSVTHLERL